MAYRKLGEPPVSFKGRILSRREIEDLIAKDHKIIIVNDVVLKVDPWLKYHPGGEKAILHMVGRDATDEVTAYVIGRCQRPNSIDRY